MKYIDPRRCKQRGNGLMVVGIAFIFAVGLLWLSISMGWGAGWAG